MVKKIVRSENEDQRFVFCGEGLGIAGLPHRVTLKQAENLGLLNALEAAIENGNYCPDAGEPAGSNQHRRFTSPALTDDGSTPSQIGE